MRMTSRRMTMTTTRTPSPRRAGAVLADRVLKRFTVVADAISPVKPLPGRAAGRGDLGRRDAGQTVASAGRDNVGALARQIPQ